MSTFVTTALPPLIETSYENSFKKIIILFILLGILMLFIGYMNQKHLRPFPHIIYKYIPKVHDDELFFNPPVKSIYSSLMSDPHTQHKPLYDSMYRFNNLNHRANFNIYDNADTYYEY